MRRAFTVMLGLLLVAAAPAGAQVDSAASSVSARAPAPQTTPARAATLSIVSRPDAPLAGVALVVDGGAAEDRPGREGERWVFAQLLVDAVERLAPGGKLRRGGAGVWHDRMELHFVVEPDDIAATLEDIEASMRTTPPVSTFEAVRTRILASFAFEASSPVLEMEQERRALLDGFGSPWARPILGTRISIEGLSAADIGALGRALDVDHLHLAVVGPVDPVDLRAAWAGSDIRVAERSPDRSGAETATAFVGPLAWNDPDRVTITREVTNTWISVAFPVPADVPATLLEFLMHRMREEIDTRPPDPFIFDADLRIARRPEGRLIVVEVSVLPEATEDWTRRVLQTPSTAARTVADDYFHWLRRRFRSEVLLRESAPEALAARIARDAMHGIEQVRDIGSEAWQLSSERIERVVDSLGPPRVLVYGPDLGPGG